MKDKIGKIINKVKEWPSNIKAGVERDNAYCDICKALSYTKLNSGVEEQQVYSNIMRVIGYGHKDYRRASNDKQIFVSIGDGKEYSVNIYPEINSITIRGCGVVEEFDINTDGSVVPTVFKLNTNDVSANITFDEESDSMMVAANDNIVQGRNGHIEVKEARNLLNNIGEIGEIQETVAITSKMMDYFPEVYTSLSESRVKETIGATRSNEINLETGEKESGEREFDEKDD